MQKEILRISADLNLLRVTLDPGDSDDDLDYEDQDDDSVIS